MKESITLFAVIIGLLLLTSCNSDKCKYDYEEYGLNGPVKSVKVAIYKAESKFGEIVKGDLDGGYLATFNSIGNLKVISYFDDEGNLTMLEKYKYNEENNLIDRSAFESNGSLCCQLTYVYQDGRMVSLIQKSNSLWDDKEEIIEYRNTWNGEDLMEQDMFRNGEFVSKRRYTNRNKQCQEWILYDKDGKEISTGSEMYDDCGRLIQHEHENNWCFEVQRNDKNLPIYLKNLYPVNNTLIGEHREGVYYVEYEYDTKGNWIKQIIYEGDAKKPETISEREITYQ